MNGKHFAVLPFVEVVSPEAAGEDDVEPLFRWAGSLVELLPGAWADFMLLGAARE